MNKWTYAYTLLACLSAFSLVGTKKNKKSASDEKDHITIGVGESYQVKLASNNTTGYAWTVACKPEKQDKITIDQQSVKSNAALIGSGGTDTFTVKGVKKGKVTCTFTYQRPWEEKAVKKQTYVFNVGDKKKHKKSKKVEHKDVA